MYIIYKRPCAILDSNYILQQIPSAYLDSLCVHSQQTIKNYAYVLVKWLGYCEDKRLDWRKATIGNFSEYLESSNVSNSTTNYHIRRLVEFYEFATRAGVCNKAFSKLNAKRLRRRVSHSPAYLPDIADVSRFLQVLPEPYKLMAAAMAICGLRRNEALSLRVADLVGTESSGVLRIKLKGKGGVARTVSVPLWLVAKLKAQTAGGLIFSHNGKSYTGASVSHVFRRCSKSLKLGIHPHLLRHLFSTSRLIELQGAGIDQEVVITILQHELGHSHRSTTEIYLEMAKVAWRTHGSSQVLAKLFNPLPGGEH